MTPLVNVVLGVVVLRERLRPLQWVAVGVAALGVAYLTAAVGYSAARGARPRVHVRLLRPGQEVGERSRRSKA